jgi:phytoene desaturase
MTPSTDAQNPKRAIVIGAGFGGLALAIRLQSMGFATTLVEALDKPGGRAYVREVDGYTFDMGPTVITVPHFIEELFSLEYGKPMLDAPDFPASVLAPDARVTEGVSGGPSTSEYCTLRPLTPFYRINFDDGTFFDYDGDPVNTRRQIREICEADLEGYERFHDDAKAIFERGFLELGYTRFLSVGSMLAVVPDLLKLDAVRNLFRFASKYFSSDKLRQVFSFETLLVGGNPMSVPAIYAMIHFVEKTWGVHYCMGGTGALVNGFVRKFQDLGGTVMLSAPVDEILVRTPDGQPAGRFTKRVACGVRLESGAELEADLVVSNADYGTTMLKMLPAHVRPSSPDWVVRAKRYTMSLLVIYFGFEARAGDTDRLRHHNIILGPRYEALLTEIFSKKVIGKDFSQYLHVPTLTDPSMAPAGHHAAYTLIPVPNNASGLDWDEEGPALVDRVLSFLEERGHIPDLAERLTHKSWVTPDYFQQTLRSHQGNGFGLEPVLTQSAWFRPHNRVRDIEGLYLVGASTQPGAGTPSVMMSAKMTARCVADDFAEVLVHAAEVAASAEAQADASQLLQAS